MTTSPVTAITDELLAEIEDGCLDSVDCPLSMLSDLAAELRALRVENADIKRQLAVGRKALGKLATVPGCGCSFPCRCGGEEWTKAELEGRMDFADEALAAMQEQAE